LPSFVALAFVHLAGWTFLGQSRSNVARQEHRARHVKQSVRVEAEAGVATLPEQDARVEAEAGSEAPPERDAKVLAFEQDSVIDEIAKLEESTFPIAPKELIEKAKYFLAYDQGVSKPELLADDFQFMGPVVGPLSKEAFLKAVGGFDFSSAFPDANPEWHHFRVDPFEPNRVWMTARGRGTNTAESKSPLFKKPTGKSYVNPPQACSVKFNEEGLATQYTIGYVMDRKIGNTGGLGGIYGILYAMGKPLPFREAKPWKPSTGYKMFLKLGNLLQKLQKKK